MNYQFWYSTTVVLCTINMSVGNRQGCTPGSVLGICFLSYMSMTLLMEMIRLFSDDRALFVQCKGVGLVYNDMKKGLIQRKECFYSNWLTLNLAKTCNSIYHGPKIHPRLYDTMALNGQIINRQRCFKYLGLTIDETFNWGQHVSNLTKPLSKDYRIFNKIKHMIPKRHKMTISTLFIKDWIPIMWKVCIRLWNSHLNVWI